MSTIALPILPTVPDIGFEVLFSDDERADQWIEAKKTREDFICNLIKNTIACQFQDPNNPNKFYITSPGIRGKKYSLSWFGPRLAHNTGWEPIGDFQRDDPKDFVSEIPDDYILVDAIFH